MDSFEQFRWVHPQALSPVQYRCGYCGWNVATTQGYTADREFSSDLAALVAICPNCTLPTAMTDGGQYPGVAYGEDVNDISDPQVAALYVEARRCLSVSAYTAAVLACRKLLMHVAVAKGAKPGEKFIAYVEHLAGNGYVPPDAKEWVDHIRLRSNEANHEIVLMSREDAEELINFSGMLLQLVYEFPAAMRRKTASNRAE